MHDDPDFPGDPNEAIPDDENEYDTGDEPEEEE